MGMIKIKLLKLLDRVIGVPLLRLFKESKRDEGITPETIKKILLIRPGGMGDLVLLLPMIQILGEKLQNAEIDVLCEKRNAAICKFSKKIKKVYLYDNIFDLVKCLRNKYDLTIDTEQWHRFSAIVALLTKAPVRIGFNTNDRRKLFTRPVPYKCEDYEIKSFLHLIAPVTGEVQFNREEPFIDITQAWPAHLLPGVNPEKDKIACIFPGSSVKEKKWQIEKFAKVASALINKGYKPVLIGSSKDSKIAKKINHYEKSCLDLTGKTSIKDVAGILKKSELLLSADSGLMHLAYAIGTPTISLFGASNIKKWAPKGKNHITISKRLTCSPCSQFGYVPKCRKKLHCMSLITAEEVISAV
jgi:lipopolysaccharide heptosyltransferase II